MDCLAYDLEHDRFPAKTGTVVDFIGSLIRLNDGTIEFIRPASVCKVIP